MENKAREIRAGKEKDQVEMPIPASPSASF
jgi:hypothetical protein